MVLANVIRSDKRNLDPGGIGHRGDSSVPLAPQNDGSNSCFSILLDHAERAFSLGSCVPLYKAEENRGG